MAKLFVILCALMKCCHCEVLDPALFLSPSPPLTDNPDSLPPGQLWLSDIVRVTRNADQVPNNENQNSITPPEEQEMMENEETFWPRWRTTSYGIRGIHIPLTFSVSGNYGSGSYGTSVVGSSYGSISADADRPANAFGSYGKSAFAGSGYGNYGYPGVRIFGKPASTGWSGWGNGKWGHYGKG